MVGPLGTGGAPAVAYASRAAARITVAPVDPQGNVGGAELIDLPALPRVARVAIPAAGGAAALFVAHDDGISMIARGPDGWQRNELAAPRFARDFAVGDLDGDGHADLVVADESTNQLSVLRGGGGFASH